MLKRVLIGLLRSHETTGEKARYPELKTKYYRLERDKVWQEIISVLKKTGNYKILHEVKHVGEIVLEKRGIRSLDVTITLFAINPVLTAVDIYSASRGSLGDLGSNYFTILDIYKKLDQKLAAYKM